jgi:uncharacterized membrane protein
MARKKGVAKLASTATKRAEKATKQARKRVPMGKKRSLGSRISKALPGSSGAIAGIAGTIAANKGARAIAGKLKDKAGSGSMVEKAVEDVQELVGGGDQSASQVKLREIIQEYVDVSVPAQFAYEHWTQYEDLSHVFKGIEAVKEDKGAVKWSAKIGPARREWGSEITEDRESERIEWKSKGGAKNTGIVAFHPLSDNLTRIMVQMEYHPRGFVENVGNLMRIQRRRVRRDLRLFKHHVEIKVGPPPPPEKESSKGQADQKSSSREDKSDLAATKETADEGGSSRSKEDSGNGGSSRSKEDSGNGGSSRSKEDSGNGGSSRSKDDSGNGGSSRSKDDSGNGSSRYEDRTMDDLLKRAAELGIEGRSNMNKAQLIEALRK